MTVVFWPAFGAILTAIWGLYFFLSFRLARENLHRRLRRLLKIASRPRRSFLVALGDRFDESAWGQQLAAELAAMDLPLKASKFVAFQVLSGAIVYLVSQHMFELQAPAAFSLAVALPFWGGYLLRRLRRGRYAEKVNSQLPEVARLLSSALRAGLSVQQGIERVAMEVKPPAGAEFRRVYQEQRLGAELPESLQAMARRIGSREVALLANTILLQREAGGDLAATLDDMAETLAARATTHQEIRSLTAESRFVALVLPFLPFLGALVMNMFIPGFLNPLFTGPGLLVLGIFVLIQLLAFVIIRKITDIQV